MLEDGRWLIFVFDLSVSVTVRGETMVSGSEHFGYGLFFLLNRPGYLFIEGDIFVQIGFEFAVDGD